MGDQYTHHSVGMPAVYVWGRCDYSVACPHLAAGLDDNEVLDLLQDHIDNDHIDNAHMKKEAV